MIVRKELDPRPLNGGINMMARPSSAPAVSELPWSQGFWPHGQGIRQFGRIEELVTSPVDVQIMHALTGTAGSFAAFGNGAVLWEPNGMGQYGLTFSVVSGVLGGFAMETVQWNRDVYVVSSGSTDGGTRSLAMLRPYIATTPNAFPARFFLGASGAAPPAPTIANGGPGVLPAGSYSYRFTEVDPESNTESALSAVSNTITILINESINVTMPASPAPNPRFTTRRLYRSVQNQPNGPWLRVTEFSNLTAVYHDNTPVSQLGVAADPSVIQLPRGCFSITAYQNRLWATDGRFVYVSHANRPEEFDGLSTFAYPNDEVLQVVGGKQELFVVCRDKIRTITGNGATSWRQDVLDSVHGGTHRRCAIFAGEALYWVSNDDAYSSEGISAGMPLSGDGPDKKLGPLLETRKYVQFDYTLGEYDWRHLSFLESFSGIFFMNGSLGASRPLSVFSRPTYSVGYSTTTRGYYPWTLQALPNFAMSLDRKRTDMDPLANPILLPSKTVILQNNVVYAYNPLLADPFVPVTINFPGVDVGQGKAKITTLALKTQPGETFQVQVLVYEDRDFFENGVNALIIGPPALSTDEEWKRISAPKLDGYPAPLVQLIFTAQDSEPIYLEQYALEIGQDTKRLRKV